MGDKEMLKEIKEIIDMPEWKELASEPKAKIIKKKLNDTYTVMCKEDEKKMDEEDEVEDLYDSKPKMKDKNMAAYIIARLKTKKE
ncbi:MAG: hypothetical protein HGB12_00185 [Bacteroidetes bacterium]|nr:hypothetical protein [Bacteroidota bacterium]